MNELHVHPTSYGYAVSWGPRSSGDAVAMVTFADDGSPDELFICRRCCDAACEHVQAAINHRARKEKH